MDLTRLTRQQLIQEVQKYRQQLEEYQTRAIRSGGGELEEREEPGTLRGTERLPGETEQTFRTLAEESPNMIFINRQGRVVYANKKCEELMGYTREEFYDPDFDFLSLIAPDSMDLVRKNFRRHSLGEEIPPYEYGLVKKNGKRIDAIITSKLVQYHGKWSILGIVTDITEQKRIQKALQESEMFYRQVIENAAGVPFRLVFGPEPGQGYYEFIGTGIEAITGYSATEFNEALFQDLIIEMHPQLPEIPNDPGLCRRAFCEKKIPRYQVDVLIRTRSGEQKWLSDRSLPLLEEKSGRVIGSFGILQDITPRKKAEEKLRLNEERLSLALEATSDGLWDVNLKTGSAYYSPRFYAMLGYKNEELSPAFETWRKLLHPDDRQKAEDEIETHIQTRSRGYHVEYRLRTREGHWRWILGRGKVVEWDASGEPVRLVGTHIDITERKRAEAALRFRMELERLITTISTRFIHLPSERILEEINLAIAEMARFMGVDRSYVLIFSQDHSEFSCVCEYAKHGLSRFCSTFQHVSTLDLHLWLQKMKKNEVQMIININQLPSTESQAPVYMKKTGILSVLEIPIMCSGALFGVLGMATVEKPKTWAEDDIILLKIVAEIFAHSFDRRKMEEALRESEEKYRHLIENSNDAIYLLYNRKFKVINEKFKEMFQVNLEEVNAPEFDFLQLVAPRSRGFIEERVQRLARGEELESKYEFTALARNGREIEVEASVSYIPYKDGVASQGILRDITTRKHLEEQLRQAQKMEAVGRLAGGVAHDFNNLLTAITGYTQLLLTHSNPNEPIYSDLIEIKKAADRAASLTHQLLAFSRKQILQPHYMDLNEVILNIDKLLRRLIGEDIELITVLGSDLGTILADRNQIEQVIMNLAVNARDAMPRGGKLILETKVMEVRERITDKDETIPAGSYVAFIVSDNGEGMDPETRSHIFEPFFTTKDLGKGTGLGLATVYGIVKQSGGYIEVDSEFGKGSVFTIYFPRHKEPHEPGVKPRPDLKSLYGDETILLVEDEDIVRNFTQKVLRQFGYQVLSARYGEEAFRLVQEERSQIDLVITDVIMPRMSGRKLAEELAREINNIKILFISGYAEEAISDYGPFHTDRSFLQKPFTPFELVKRVREILDRS